MRIFLVAAAFSFLASSLSVPAAARYGHCYVETEDPRPVSDILDFGEDLEHLLAAKQAFAAIYGRKADCETTRSTPSEAESFKRQIIDVNNLRVVETGWTGSYGAGATPSSSSPGGAFISVRDSGRAAEIEAWENSVLQAHRESAALQAKTIAQTAASRAEYDRLWAKVKAEMKKRGNKQ